MIPAMRMSSAQSVPGQLRPCHPVLSDHNAPQSLLEMHGSVALNGHYQHSNPWRNFEASTLRIAGSLSGSRFPFTASAASPSFDEWSNLNHPLREMLRTATRSRSLHLLQTLHHN